MVIRVLPPDEAKRIARERLGEWKRGLQRSLLSPEDVRGIRDSPYQPPRRGDRVTLHVSYVGEGEERGHIKDDLDLVRHLNSNMRCDNEPEETFLEAKETSDRIIGRLMGLIRRKGLDVTVQDLLARALEKQGQGKELRRVEQLLIELREAQYLIRWKGRI